MRAYAASQNGVGQAGRTRFVLHWRVGLLPYSQLSSKSNIVTHGVSKEARWELEDRIAAEKIVRIFHKKVFNGAKKGRGALHGAINIQRCRIYGKNNRHFG